jgi:hypothetical protein
VPLADQLNGRGLMGYKKNVRVIGHNDVLNRLNNGNLGWLDDCAYVSAYYGANDVTAGLAIIDAESPAKPEAGQDPAGRSGLPRVAGRGERKSAAGGGDDLADEHVLRRSSCCQFRALDL